MSSTYTVPSTAVYQDSRSGLRYRYEAGAEIPMETAYACGMAGAGSTADGAVTATADGAGPAVVPDGAAFAAVTSGDANHIVTLPTPTPGAVVALSSGATGYELRTSAPATVALNGGSGANAESAIAANTLVVCVCRTPSAWLCSDTTTAGVVTPTQAAAV